MKNFLRLITVILTLVSFNKNAFSCDAIKNVSIGENFSKYSEILDFIDVYNQEDYDEGTTVEFQSNTTDYCPDMGLDNTILKVFIYQSKIVGIRLETWDIEVQENEIYNFVKNYYGTIDEEAKRKNWVGYEDLSIGSNKLLYGKMENNNGIVDGIMESFDITTEELMDYTVSEDMMQVGE
tara:strand:- start:138 stop:677 length:540 start_codon:yes stop_codon:yes gene_type:complete